jgi:chromosome segregation ATPase
MHVLQAASTAARAELEAKNTLLHSELKTAQDACAEANGNLHHAQQEHESTVQSLQEKHTAAAAAMQVQLSDHQQQLLAAQTKAEEDGAAAAAANQKIQELCSKIDTYDLKQKGVPLMHACIHAPRHESKCNFDQQRWSALHQGCLEMSVLHGQAPADPCALQMPCHAVPSALPMPPHLYCCLVAELEALAEKLSTHLEEATTKQADTESELSISRAQEDQLSKDLQEAQQAAAAAAEESKATIEGLEQQLAAAQEAQVCHLGHNVSTDQP